MIRFLLALFGGFINRIRGGWFELGAFNKPINHIAFGLVFGHNLIQMVILGCSMWLGACFGWGSYIGGIIEKKVMPRGDSKILDWLFLRESNFPILRNIMALNIRGCVWSLCLAIGFLACEHFDFPRVSHVDIIAKSGLLMGFIYALSCEIAEKLSFRGNGWQVGEFLFGTYLWLICYLMT